MPLRISRNRVALDGIPLNEGKSADVASASTIDIWSGTGNLVPITGTATISAFATAPQAGAKRTLLCVSTPAFTHGANFLLPGSTDYTATAGDRIEVLAITTTQFRLSILKASVLADVSFGPNAVTVGEGGGYPTIQAAIDYIAGLPQFEAITAPTTLITTITGWSQGTSVITGSVLGSGSLTGHVEKLWFTHTSLSGKLYPLEAYKSTNIYSAIDRSEATFAGSETITYYKEIKYTILLLDEYYTESTSINVPVNIEFRSLGRPAYWYATSSTEAIVRGAAFTYGSIAFKNIEISGSGFMGSSGSWGTVNNIELSFERVNFAQEYNDLLSPSLYCGSLTVRSCYGKMQPVIPLAHFINPVCGGDFIVDKLNVFIKPNTIAAPDARLFDFIDARNTYINECVAVIEDQTNAVTNVGIVAQILSGKLTMTQSGIVFLAGTSNPTCALVWEDMNGASSGNAVVHISDSYILAPTSSGTKKAWDNGVAGSTATVTIQNCGTLSADTPSAGSLSVTNSSLGAQSTGAQTCTLGTNAPAAVGTLTPNTWKTVVLTDGSTGYIPVWK